MGKLSKYAKESDIMNIDIKYGSERFKFNLNDELVIKETNRDNEIKNHPRSYAFLSMLNVKLKTVVKDLHTELKATYSSRLKAIKDSGKYGSVKEAEFAVLRDKKYKALQSKISYVEEKKEEIEVAVRSFEQRKDLLQTLSANTRREK